MRLIYAMMSPTMPMAVRRRPPSFRSIVNCLCGYGCKGWAGGRKFGVYNK